MKKPSPGTQNDIQQIFKSQLKIEAKVIAIDALFVNERRARKTNYQPSYQRNYVWDDDKATYFIESILLGTEIPPIILFMSGDSKIEVVDGRQRYETIKRFLEDEFKLKGKGLLKLKDLKNKKFSDLKELKNTFWETKLRVIEFSFRDESLSNQEKEDKVKKEIFKRYNSGITPLKSVDIDKAKYQDNSLNALFKKRIMANDNVKKDLADVFFFDTPFDIEKMLKKIRQQLVIPYIPINYYSNANVEIIERFFNHLSDTTDDAEGFYLDFIKKVKLLKAIKQFINNKGTVVNRLVMECLFWGAQILNQEGFDTVELLNSEKSLSLINSHISKNIHSYRTDDSNFYKQVIERYTKTAELLSDISGLNFDLYLNNNEVFRSKNKDLAKITTNSTELSRFKSLRLNKPDASSNTIDDICTQMRKERFLIRPTYQRKEVIDGIKSSAIIESILLGIKLPPIFVFKREDGVAEVLDGQQRLLSILGFLGKEFMDENQRFEKSKKNLFALKQLKVLQEVDGKRFADLPTHYQDRILDFDLWVIEINAEHNKDFDPIDLFIRLNYKPYPILENTFEMWNSYADRDIVDKIKDMHEDKSAWFYLRKDNRRMEDETLITYLTYLEYLSPNPDKKRALPEILDIYSSGGKINIRIKPKRNITATIDEKSNKKKFLSSCVQLEDTFIRKVKLILSFDSQKTDEQLRHELNDLMNVAKGKTRSYQSFYALWFVLQNIPLSVIKLKPNSVRNDVMKAIRRMRTTNDVSQFKSEIESMASSYYQ